MKNLSIWAALLGLTFLTSPAFATPTAANASSASEGANPAQLRFDVEVDPLAYVAQGHSLHLGLGVGRLRFDLGTFSAVVPAFVHRQSGFEAMSGGYGAKLDVFVWERDQGPFVGVEGAWLRQHVRDSATHLQSRVTGWMLGGRLGWHLPLPEHFYIKPWLGVGRHFGPSDIAVGKRVFHQSHLLLFPTFHIGYGFP